MADKRDQIRKEFAGKGTVPILLALGGYRSRYSELKDVADISSSTLSNRLKEGIENGLWEKHRLEDEIPTRDAYSLTEKGKEYYEVAEKNQLPEKWGEYRSAKYSYHRNKDFFLHRLAGNPGDLLKDQDD